MDIIPTILDKEFVSAETKIDLIKDLVKWAQVDVIDGIFTPGKSFELELLSRLAEEQQLLWDIHLMVKEPEKWIEKCVYVGAVRVIGQVEMMRNRGNFIGKVKDSGMEAGLAFDVGSEVKDIPDEIDAVLLMARKAGFGEAETEVNIFDRIEKLNRIRKERGLEFVIGVDGGVSGENIGRYKEAGVDIVYVGGAIFGGNVEKNFFSLKLMI